MIGILSLLLALPLLGLVIVMFIPKRALRAVQGVGLTVMLVEFVLSLTLLDNGFAHPGFQFVESIPWIQSFGISYKVGIDGIALWLVLLTTLLSPISLLVSFGSIRERVKEYVLSFLLLELGMLGAFVALDLFLFYVFWELMLIPMALIIGVWGGPERVYAAVKFFIYTMVGSVLMLIGILYIVWTYAKLSGTATFDLEKLSTLAFDANTQYWLFLAFAFAFAIKIPMFPFHTWLPDAHVQAPTGGSVILAAVLLKLGAYGFLRFAMPLFPVASVQLVPIMAGIGITGIIYGAFAAWVQRDVKKLIAYSSVSHMGFVVLGMFAMTSSGVSGAILQMVNHGISTGALFILVGVIYDRLHTRMFDDLGGLAKVMPWYALIFVIITMSSIGLPGTNGFIGEFMIISGAFFSQATYGLGQQRFVFAGLAATGVILAAVYMLHAVLRMFWGTLRSKEHEQLQDLNSRELIALIPLVALVFAIGLYPRFFLQRIDPAVNGLIADYEHKARAGQRLQRPTILNKDRDTQKQDTPRVLAGARGDACAGAEEGCQE